MVRDSSVNVMSFMDAGKACLKPSKFTQVKSCDPSPQPLLHKLKKKWERITSV